MDLLYTLAPYKAHGPDRFARVLDNWALYDRAGCERRVACTLSCCMPRA